MAKQQGSQAKPDFKPPKVGASENRKGGAGREMEPPDTTKLA